MEAKKISDLIPNAATGLEANRANMDAVDLKVRQDLANAEKYAVNTPKQAYGVAAQYKNQLAKCRFKLIVYWKLKKDGTPFMQHEINAGHNRKPIPSIDFDTYKRINHEDAYNALLDKVFNEAHRMFKAILVYCDHANSEEHWIASFNCQNLNRSTILPVNFKPVNEYGHKLFDGYEGYPIRRDKMRFYEK